MSSSLAHHLIFTLKRGFNSYKSPSATTTDTLEFASSVESQYLTAQTRTFASSGGQPTRGLISFSEFAAYIDEKFRPRKLKNTRAPNVGYLGGPQRGAEGDPEVQFPEEFVIHITGSQITDDTGDVTKAEGPSGSCITNI